MAKKKKTQPKAIVRGFATTSVPKKVQPAEADSVISNNEDLSALRDADPPPSEPLVPAGQSADDPDRREEQASQTLVDKFQDKTDREIVRMLKTIDQERRFGDTLMRLELDSAFVDRIITLARDVERQGAGKHLIDEPEEKVLLRLAITYGVLRRLGYSEGRVEECLSAIDGVDLDDAYDWACILYSLQLHCTPIELAMQDVAREQPRSKTPKLLDTPQTPRTSSHSQFVHPAGATPTTPVSPSFGPAKPGRLDVNAPAFVPAASRFGQAPTAFSSPASGGEHSHSTPSPSGQQSPLDDPNADFVRLKMQISDLTTHRRPDETRDIAILRDLQRRLEIVKEDYMFNEREAEAQFRIEREKADVASLRSRLRGDIIAPAPASSLVAKQPKSSSSKSQSLAAVVPNLPSDIFDEDDELPSGGVFELLEEMPATETTEQGMTIHVHDMALPKQFSGRTPKMLLSERVHKTDRFAAISYKEISGASRVKRAAVNICWGGGKISSWSMENDACYDTSQAEQYISTVALHALTFPGTEGFASGGSVAAGAQTHFRLLPAIYRDLWDKLETQRRLADDTTNRRIWAKLKMVLQNKLDFDEKASEKITKQSGTSTTRSDVRNQGPGNDLTPEQVIAGFQARQSSTAYQEMLRQRDQLPIARYRNEITSILDTSQILVLSGETGCGKSTQVPAFILEDRLSKGQPCKIYCTEPRRISAISLAQRVSKELGEPSGVVGTAGSIVGYSIRLESNITSRTQLAYVTNGIALRMLEGGTGQGGKGTAFDEITHVIIDEVHERTIESDFLLIVLKSLLHERPDLKIVLMSATVDADKISHYFGGAPVLQVPGRTFPVDVRFLEDAIELTRWNVAENSPYARRDADQGHSHRGKARPEWSEDVTIGEDDEDSMQENVKLEKRYSSSTAATINRLDERLVPFDLIIRLLEHVCLEDETYVPYSSAILIFMPGMAEIRRLNDMLMEHPAFASDDKFKIYPLHSTISSEHQGAVFDIPPPGIRKIVIATNIAETGITIPDITCVIDTGKHREMRFDEKRQISRLIETYVAKSNAAQRRGRAGRVQSGLCFHLFTKTRHDTKMAPHPDPEMMRLSLSDLALRIKIMKVKLGSSIEDVLSRALDPPLPVNIQRAVSALVRALTTAEEITPMGRLLSKLPTDVHLGKFLLIATLFRCLDTALTIAATLNSKSPFVSPLGREQEADRAKSSFRVENSDFLTIHNAFSSWRRACTNGVSRKFCRDSFLSHQNLQQIEELRQQFLGYLVDSSFIQVNRTFVKELSRARYSRGKARFVSVPPELDVNSDNIFLLNAALGAGLYPKILSVDSTNGDMKTITNNQTAFFHPSSINFGKRATDFGASHLCYFTLMQSRRLYAWETGPVDEVALILLCGEPEFKLLSDTVNIDRKIKYYVPPRTGIALKILRNQLGSILSTQMRAKPLAGSQLQWNDLAMMVLGKNKPKERSEPLDSITLIAHR
ncbi:uncharacterized protein FIBRA_02943 [Fibroporia radiculosa]|uniref:RNA helicase n=1 Tax=Fibroporia radiculosa TaxID=599839 RepID=J4HVQ0_9APHY|nr:uncharacterized protein FIBRA_02943 [Fibroporia radiculosa]CCM00897.1 predicted protein [Fibroporia radiculosa]